MIIKIDDREFDGYVGNESDNKVEFIINTSTDFGLVAEMLTTLKQIEAYDALGTSRTVYTNVAPVSLTRAGTRTYVLMCTIKKDEIGELQTQVDELNSAIDSLLVVMLEGDEEDV